MRSGGPRYNWLIKGLEEYWNYLGTKSNKVFRPSLDIHSYDHLVELENAAKNSIGLSKKKTAKGINAEERAEWQERIRLSNKTNVERSEELMQEEPVRQEEGNPTLPLDVAFSKNYRKGRILQDFEDWWPAKWASAPPNIVYNPEKVVLLPELSKARSRFRLKSDKIKRRLWKGAKLEFGLGEKKRTSYCKTLLETIGTKQGIIRKLSEDIPLKSKPDWKYPEGITIYTDGSSKTGYDTVGNKHRTAGWGFLVLEEGEIIDIRCGRVVTNKETANEKYKLGANKHTNNTGEISAIAMAVAWAIASKRKGIMEIRYDSEIAAAAAQGYGRSKRNLVLVHTCRSLLSTALSQGIIFRFTHVSSHTGEQCNEAADMLADLGARGARL